MIWSCLGKCRYSSCRLNVGIR